MWSVEGPAIWAPISCIQLYLEDMTTHQTSISNRFAISVWRETPLSPVISPDMLFHGVYNYLLKKTILEHFFLKLCVVLLLLFLENNKLTTGCYQSPLSTGSEYVRTHPIEKGIAKRSCPISSHIF